MLKHYIHCHEGYNLNKGGSVGYLSTLFASFEKYGHFCTDESIRHCFMFPNIQSNERLYNRALDKVIFQDFQYINDFQNVDGMQVLINERKRWFREILPVSEYGKIDFGNIKSIHVHGAYNFLPVFNTLSKEGVANQVVKILTTHNPHKPELEDMELICRGRNWKDADIRTFRYFFKERDYWAFKLSDALIFPTEYSMEGYLKSWPEFEKIIEDKKVYFCTTSGQKKQNSISSDFMRSSLGIPQGATVLLYLGRFVNIRGYDILIESAKRIIEQNKNVYFVVVGESSKTTEFDTSQWIQVPFTTEPGNYINMADACLCPNRGSLFDLSMIEILAMGTPLLGCDIGGYKWLKGKTAGAILAIPNDVDSFVRNILDFLNTSTDERRRMSLKNIELYESCLHLSYFHQNYTNTISQIYRDFGIFEHRNKNDVCALDVDFERNYKRNEEQVLFFATPPAKPQPVPDKKPEVKPVKVDTESPRVVQPATMANSAPKESSKAKPSNAVSKPMSLLSDALNTIVPVLNNSPNLSPTQKKLRKLKDNPKLFFVDVIKKRVG